MDNDLMVILYTMFMVGFGFMWGKYDDRLAALVVAYLDDITARIKERTTPPTVPPVSRDETDDEAK